MKSNYPKFILTASIFATFLLVIIRLIMESLHLEDNIVIVKLIIGIIAIFFLSSNYKKISRGVT